MERARWEGERVDRLHKERRPGIWHSEALESDGVGGRGVGRDGHRGWVSAYDSWRK